TGIYGGYTLPIISELAAEIEKSNGTRRENKAGVWTLAQSSCAQQPKAAATAEFKCIDLSRLGIFVLYC
ncbi:unnamed protein product, partial [Ceratitis capitata]